MRILKSLFQDNSLDAKIRELSRAVTAAAPAQGTDLPALTEQFRQEIRDQGGPEAVDKLLPRAFAAVTEGARQLLGQTFSVLDKPVAWTMVPYPEQVLCGVALHLGTIAEMATGEGKTLAAVLPAYLNALTGNPVIIVTANEYLAKRDSQWMHPLYAKLGLTVGCSLPSHSPDEKRNAYACDVVYVTPYELGFDYLRDNYSTRKIEHKVIRREPALVVVDEADFVFLDSAKTPLVISKDEGKDSLILERQDDYRARVERLVAEQQQIIERIVARVQKSITTAPNLAALDMQLIHMGDPKSLKLAEFLRLPGMAEAWDKERARLSSGGVKSEMSFMREQLLFTFNERDQSVTVTERGAQILAPEDPDFMTVPDISTQLHELSQQQMTPTERMDAQEKIQLDFAQRQHQLTFVQHLLRAYCLFKKNINYILTNGQVILVDPQTGRPLPNRRMGGGLHAAVEIKEGVEIQSESSVAGVITLQSLFRQFHKLAGMTGTAKLDEPEFLELYGLRVVQIPTHSPCIRQVQQDSVFTSQAAKMKAVLKEIQAYHHAGRPILIGTPSVEASELVSQGLTQMGLQHSVLNAKQHAQEAEIIAAAGAPGAITVAANMAGRGTDIKLIGNAARLGGLHIIGLERYEARRLDNQLSGRCARQGDPGSVHFFASFEDDLLRLFGNPMTTRLLGALGGSGDQAIAHPLLTRAVAEAQRSMENRNRELREQTKDLDAVLAPQRQEYYTFRDQVLRGETREPMTVWTHRTVDGVIDSQAKDRNFAQVLVGIEQIFGMSLRGQLTSWEMAKTEAAEKILSWYEEHRPEDEVELALMCMDAAWLNHLCLMTGMQSQISLESETRMQSFRKDGFRLYEEFRAAVGRLCCRMLYRAAHMEQFQKERSKAA